MSKELQEKLEEIQEDASLSAMQKHVRVHRVLSVETEKHELTRFERFLLRNKSCLSWGLLVILFAFVAIN